MYKMYKEFETENMYLNTDLNTFLTLHVLFPKLHLSLLTHTGKKKCLKRDHLSRIYVVTLPNFLSIK